MILLTTLWGRTGMLTCGAVYYSIAFIVDQQPQPSVFAELLANGGLVAPIIGSSVTPGVRLGLILPAVITAASALAAASHGNFVGDFANVMMIAHCHENKRLVLLATCPRVSDTTSPRKERVAFVWDVKVKYNRGILTGRKPLCSHFKHYIKYLLEK